MAGEVKDLEYYMAHPDEMPFDPETLSGLAGEVFVEEDGSETGEETPAVAEPTKAEPLESTAQKEPAAVAETDEEAPVATRDGKKTIPYSVLATERERRQAAERVATDLANQLEELRQRAEAGKPNTPAQVAEVSDLLADEDLAEVVKDFPAVQKLIEAVSAMRSQVQDANSKLQEVSAREAERVEESNQIARRETQEAIEGIPKLLYIQHENPELWEAAIEADNRIKTLPINKGLTLSQRFEKAVAIVETIYGPIDLPAKYQPANEPAPKPVETPETLAAKVKAAVDQVTTNKPRTLNELPGGVTPSANSLDDVTSQSAAALGTQMMNMTPDQINRLLDRVA